ncbi:uncharacterized protein LOC103381597 [Cynoglossus semilaevis]|uniref:uncharacterized protein LOC103381597 n=1 Tax=Cynoglossus semilaevis TaxID=244447 RepID=UPI000D62831C|nr:uncharacterized protein LOC103381597 [Cynoglossus semilaevis]
MTSVGYVTGSAVPENKSTQTDLVGLDSTAEVGVFPETVAANGEAAGVPEPEVTADGTNIQSQPVPGADSLPAGQSETTEASVTKGQGTKSAKPDCGPSGVPNGQWMKIRPGYNGGAGTQTKGYRAGAGVQNRHGAKPHDGASAGAASNGGGSKASMSGYHPGGYSFPALANGYGAGVQYPYAGNVQQPGYGQGSYLGAAYGNPYAGSKNGQNAGVQPDYAGLVQGDPNAEAKSGVPQLPFNGFPMVPAGLDGMSQLKPQSAGLGPNGKSDTYGGMAGVHFGGKAAGMGVEKSSKKYGIGGLQFGGQPYNGNGGASRFGYAGGPYEPRADGKSFGKYGHGGFPTSGQHFGLGANGPVPGQYGYGRIPYEAQPAGVSHEYKPAGKYGQSGASYQPEAPGLGHAGQVGSKHDNMGAFNVQPLESAPVTTAEGDSLPFETLPSEPDAVGTLFGEQPTPADAVEAEGKSVYGYDDAGFINGQVQPQVAASPAAPGPSPSLASVVSDVVPGGEDLPDIVDGTDLDSAPATGFQSVAKMDEETEDMQQQQLPRQIHIKHGICVRTRATTVTGFDRGPAPCLDTVPCPPSFRRRFIFWTYRLRWNSFSSSRVWYREYVCRPLLRFDSVGDHIIKR